LVIGPWTEAGLFGRAFKLGYQAIALPKLHVMTVSEWLGVFFRGLIVWANKLYRPEKVTVYPNDVRPVIRLCGFHTLGRPQSPYARP
jgi:hypothetical protein